MKDDKVLEYIGTIKALEEELKELKKEKKELDEKYINLRARYTLQNDELIRLKVFLNREGYSEDNDRHSKK